ncbi:unnamed protein product, partial [Phaeothamnion confervicola]
ISPAASRLLSVECVCCYSHSRAVRPVRESLLAVLSRACTARRPREMEYDDLLFRVADASAAISCRLDENAKRLQSYKRSLGQVCVEDGDLPLRHRPAFPGADQHHPRLDIHTILCRAPPHTEAVTGDGSCSPDPCQLGNLSTAGEHSRSPPQHASPRREAVGFNATAGVGGTASGRPPVYGNSHGGRAEKDKNAEDEEPRFDAPSEANGFSRLTPGQLNAYLGLFPIGGTSGNGGSRGGGCDDSVDGGTQAIVSGEQLAARLAGLGGVIKTPATRRGQPPQNRWDAGAGRWVHAPRTAAAATAAATAGRGGGGS